MMEYQKQVQDS